MINNAFNLLWVASIYISIILVKELLTWLFMLLYKKSRGKPQKPSKEWTAVLKLERPDTQHSSHKSKVLNKCNSFVINLMLMLRLSWNTNTFQKLFLSMVDKLNCIFDWKILLIHLLATICMDNKCLMKKHSTKNYCILQVIL